MMAVLLMTIVVIILYTQILRERFGMGGADEVEQACDLGDSGRALFDVGFTVRTDIDPNPNPNPNPKP